MTVFQAKWKHAGHYEQPQRCVDKRISLFRIQTLEVRGALHSDQKGMSENNFPFVDTQDACTVDT